MPSLGLALHLLLLSPAALAHSTRSRGQHRRNARCATRSASAASSPAAAAASTSANADDMMLLASSASESTSAATASTASTASAAAATTTSASVEHGAIELGLNLGVGASSTGSSAALVTAATVASEKLLASSHLSAWSSSSAPGLSAVSATSSTSRASRSTTSSQTSSHVASALAVSSSAASVKADSNAASTSAAAAASSSSSSDKFVFAHFMVGIVSTYKQADWESDMSLAASKGIDGFALNIGYDSYSVEQLGYAYAAAAAVGFHCFISFDFNYYTADNTSGVIDVLSQFVADKAQLTVDGAAYVSTFIGDGFDWATVAAAISTPLYVVPDWDASASYADDAALAGLFSWAAWPSTDNQPIDEKLSTAGDESYLGVLSGGKPYMAPISPWFFTHFGASSYDKNYLFLSETLWVDRWNQILSMGSQLKFLEIITWNDYGESHYIGPVDTPHTDDGSSAWSVGFDHTPMMDLMVPYIAAFKAGATNVTVTDDLLVYWHRPHLKAAECDGTDSAGAKPTGWDYVGDTVFVATLTAAGGSFTATSGSNAAVTHTVPAGVSVFEVPMAAGKQAFTFTTKQGSASTTSNITVSSGCYNGEYNFNYHAGEIAL